MSGTLPLEDGAEAMPSPGFAPRQGSHGKDGLNLPWACLGKRRDPAERAQVQTL